MPEQQDGYSSNVFSGKSEQLQRVVAYVEEKGFIPRELVQNEVSWFYG
jgi:glutamate dehydrogenase